MAQEDLPAEVAALARHRLAQSAPQEASATLCGAFGGMRTCVEMMAHAAIPSPALSDLASIASVPRAGEGQGEGAVVPSLRAISSELPAEGHLRDGLRSPGVCGCDRVGG